MQKTSQDRAAEQSKSVNSERILYQSLLALALLALAGGGAAWWMGRIDLANLVWAAGTVPVVLSLFVSIVRAFAAGRVGVDAIALVSMSGALALEEMLAAIVVAVMYAGGSVLEDYAVARAERDLRGLVDRAPRIAHLVEGTVLRDVPVDTVTPGDVVQVNAGEVLPVDGTVLDAKAVVDGSALTGEPIPVVHSAGSMVLSGTVNAGESFRMEAVATATDSAYAGIIRMVSAAQTAKAPFIRAADRFALFLLPLTLLVAGAAWYFSGDVLRGLAVLVVATPCPLILAAPVAFIGGVGHAARRGILIKGGGPLEALAQVRTVLFDKTGTLTVGGARLVGIETAPDTPPARVLQLAASLDQASHHVVAEAIVAAARLQGLTLDSATDVMEVQGEGISGVIGGSEVRIGSQRFAIGDAALDDWARRALRRAALRASLAICVAVDGVAIGVILMGDEIRSDAPRAIRGLRANGVVRVVMLTGDRSDTSESIGASLMVDQVLAERSPAEKVAAVEAEQSGAPTIMVGDGINDAPALAAAQVGIAMGVRGASAASQAAEVVILVDRIDRVAEAVSIARRTRRIALQSMIAGLSLSGIAMGAAAFGWLSPVQGALTQEAIDVAVILNALRTLVPGGLGRRKGLTAQALADLKAEHRRIDPVLDRLTAIAQALHSATPEAGQGMIEEAHALTGDVLIPHETGDETQVYLQVRKYLADGHGLAAMSRAHGEISHLYRQLCALNDMAQQEAPDASLMADIQRILETLVTVIRIHNAQEEDIYDFAAAAA